MTVTEANKITGGLSNTSKMPGKSWGIPAKKCKTGSKLRKIPGSVCAKCYALKGHYAYDNVQAAQENRLALWQTTPSEIWGNAMQSLIQKQSPKYFRWFDSGDLQSEKMFLDITCIARRMPKTKFWLPTRERGILIKMNKIFTFPKNLMVRVSSAMMNAEPAPIQSRNQNIIAYSGVSTGDGFNCPASRQDNECRRCRACWTQPNKIIIYKAH